MRSIRRSMTVYLLVLLAVTLGVAGWIIHHQTARSLEARLEAAEKLAEAREEAAAKAAQNRYEKRCEEEKQRVDQLLLEEARGLADIMQREYWVRFGAEWTKYRLHFAMIQPGFGPNPIGQLTWAGAGNNLPATRDPNALPGQLFRSYFANLPIPEESLQQVEAGDQRTDFFQINTLGGRVWHSKSLDGRSLPFDPKTVESSKLIDYHPSDATLSPGGEKVRRVIFQTPLFNTQPPRGPESRPGPGKGGGPKGGGGWPPANPPQPTPPTENIPKIFVQAARPQAELDAAFARFQADRDAEINRLQADRDAELDKVRTAVRNDRQRLDAVILGIGLAAFLALAVGGPLLVGRGLAPVGKLSVAVSQVSEKDFNLPHDGQDLPAELAPIHARLTQTLDLLRRAFAREKQSVADISHELRTPIASMLAIFDVTLRKPRTPEQYRAALEEGRVIAKQLGQLVERIMTLATLDAGNARTVAVRTDGADLAATCAAVIRPLAEKESLTLEVDAGAPVELDTDPDKLREILMNLLHNAVEYNKPGGRINLAARSENGSVVFEVRDTGIGMTPEVREKIFERFYRADASRHATGIHAGLGLAIVKEYVERLNGTITVESEPGVGTTFRVALAAAPFEPEPATTAGPKSGKYPREQHARAS
jgi:signal transduction histidine kinase